MNIGDGLKAATSDAARDLAKTIHARAIDLAGQKLKGRRQMYVQALDVFPADGEDVWIVSLKASARWIDDGQPKHSMLDALLASPKTKVSKKDGSKYVVVPFDQSPGQGVTTTTPAQQDLISTIKSAMKKEGIPFGKIETDAAGVAKVGKLHSFSVTGAPLKTKQGPGQGHGPLGSVRQGPTGIPFLQNVNVYQKPDPKAKKGVKKVIMTFRIASSKHQGQGRWEHPGNEGVHILEDAAQWGLETWSKEIAPALIDRVMIEISK